MRSDELHICFFFLFFGGGVRSLILYMYVFGLGFGVWGYFQGGEEEKKKKGEEENKVKKVMMILIHSPKKKKT